MAGAFPPSYRSLIVLLEVAARATCAPRFRVGLSRGTVLLVGLAVLAGCGEAGAPAPLPVAAIKTNPVELTTWSTPVRTPDELVERFRTMFAEGNRDGLKSITHCDAPPPEQARLLETYLFLDLAGEATISETALRRNNDVVLASTCDWQPTHLLDCAARNSQTGAGRSTTIPIAQIDGQYYFYFCTKTEAAN